MSSERQGGEGERWASRLRDVADMLRDTSVIQDDPQQSVRLYAERVRRVLPAERVVAVSRRDLEHPEFRVTRSTTWTDAPDPWREKGRLPLLRGGLLGELLYAGEPRLLVDPRVAPDDPGAEFLAGMRSILALPTWEEGRVLNMLLQMGPRPDQFDPGRTPEALWISNMFGRSTRNLVLSREVKEAYAALDRELRTVGDIQMSLLPREAPALPTLELATHYQTSKRAGGDYYDFFALPGGRLGILVADVSGHGTPAAVLMAVLHAIAHTMPGEPRAPHDVLAYLNRALAARYTQEGGSFVTAIYGVYDGGTRTLSYANAGHPAPLMRRRDGGVCADAHAGTGLPLGIDEHAAYATRDVRLSPGEAVVLYTDGLTEAFSASGEIFGEGRLCEAIARGAGTGESPAGAIVASVIEAVGAFAGLAHRSDDRTLVVGAVR